MAAFSGGAWAQSPPPPLASSPPKKAPVAPPSSRKSSPNSPSPAEPPGPQDNRCFYAIFDNLEDCLDYVDPQKNLTVPPPEKCCNGVRQFLKDDPECICFILRPPDNIANLLDRGKAVKLAGTCDARIPPVDQCFRESPFFLLISVPMLFVVRAAPYASVNTFLRISIAVLFPFPGNGSAARSPSSPPTEDANPSFTPSARAFLVGTSLAIVAVFL